MIDFNGIILIDYSSMIQIFMNLILPYCMLNVIVLYLFWPAIVKVVDFTGNFPTIF